MPLEYLTPEQVGTLLGCSPAWVRRNVPHKVTLGHRTVRWERADVIRWLQTQKINGGPTRPSTVGEAGGVARTRSALHVAAYRS
jgi:predicted DNA-binding transcriptional regulator AlpA